VWPSSDGIHTLEACYRYPSRNAAPHLIEIIVHLHLQRSDEARDRLWAEVDAFFENVET
jgi:hypothetical protein